MHLSPLGIYCLLSASPNNIGSSIRRGSDWFVFVFPALGMLPGMCSMVNKYFLNKLDAWLRVMPKIIGEQKGGYMAYPRRNQGLRDSFLKQVMFGLRLHSFICSERHSLVQHIPIRVLLCVRHDTRTRNVAVMKADTSLFLWNLSSSGTETISKPIDEKGKISNIHTCYADKLK